MKQTAIRQERNVATKRSTKLSVKHFHAKPTSDSLAKAHSEIDKAVKKNLLAKATAARRKAALSKAAKDAGVKLSKAKKATPAAAAKPATKKAAPKAKTTATSTKKPATKKTSSAKKPVAKKAAK